jgi:rhamnosyltransferase
MKTVSVSVIIRTLNEAKHLNALLDSISSQKLSNSNLNIERIQVIIVDSGSTDGTLLIADSYKCKIVEISRSEFSFGRSINIGCKVAEGDVLIIVSGHCIPCNDDWVLKLCLPIANGVVDYCYGRQIGGVDTKFSENQIFKKNYPDLSEIPKKDIFCNNANAALSKRKWNEMCFNEELTGLEDMDYASKLMSKNGNVGYVSDAVVYHLHDESWGQIRTRFEREALALQYIIPGSHITIIDALRYCLVGVCNDITKISRNNLTIKAIYEIFLYRVNQFYGTYRGGNNHKKLTRPQTEKYYYPK